MRWSRTLIPTLREDPSEADMPSYKLMVRAGMIRKAGGGIYEFLPLGTRTLQKAAQIVREEMSRAGSVEVTLPVVQPSEIWPESRENLLRVKDGHGRTALLGAAEEEIVARLAGNEISSHRQLPLTIFQLQLQFTTEPRPRAGIVGSRESFGADAFSFHPSMEDLDREYGEQQEVFRRIFGRADLPVILAEAEAGAMDAHEFMAPNSYGGDEMVRCPKCRYTSDVEKAECVETHGRLSASADTQEFHALKEVETPGMVTVEEVAKFLRVSPRQIVKTMVLKTDGGFVAALLRGDHTLNMTKLAKVLRVAWAELATPAEVERTTGGAFGFSGPVGLTLPMTADIAIEPMQNFVTGANRKDRHYINTNQFRDFKSQTFGDIRLAQVGDLCSRCMAPLEFVKSIRVGRTAKLGARLKATFKNEKGESSPIVMGRYELSISRLVAAAIEAHHDKSGIIWPRELAPYPVVVCSINPKDEKITQASEQIYQKLMAAGIDTLWDDRDVTPGVKFADADLVGLPVRITVGNKTLKEGTVDLKTRNNPDQTGVSSKGVVESVKNALKEYKP